MEEVRRYPVGSAHHRGVYVPWAMMKPYEDQAMRNHGQTLDRLAERGGLSPREVLCILDREGWMQSTWSRQREEDAVLELEKRVRTFERVEWEGRLSQAKNSSEIWKQKALTAQGATEKERKRRQEAEKFLEEVLPMVKHHVRSTDYEGDVYERLKGFLDGRPS